MKIRFPHFSRKLFPLFAVALSFLLPATSPAQTSISLNINYNTFTPSPSYYIQAPIATSNIIQTTYEIISPHTNFESTLDSTGSQANFTFVTITSFDDLLTEITSGNWQLITDVGTHSEKIYLFHVTATGFTSNVMPQFQITNPLPFATDVSSNIVFAWDNNPTNYTTLNVFTFNQDFSYDQGTLLDPTATTWSPGPPLGGTDTNFTFAVNYETSGTNYLTISTPTTSGNQAIPGWSSTSTLNLSEDVDFSLPPVPIPTPSSGHTLVCHFTFDDPNNLGTDSSGNGYSYNSGGGQNGGSVSGTTDAIAGGGAIQFTRNLSDNFSAGYQGWSPTPPSPVLSALAGSFSVVAWVKTTASAGNRGDGGYSGMAILSADVGGGAFDSVPIALTAGAVAFTTGAGQNNPDQTVTSIATVNDGSYHQIVVTRDETLGYKTIYIDGQRDSSGNGVMRPLSDPISLVIGAVDDASQDFSDTTFYAGYDGIMDDLQIYSGVLSADEVANLFANPGATAPNISGSPGLVFHYAFDNPNNLGQDSSGNGYDLDFNGDPEGNGVTYVTSAEAGTGAASFDGGSFLSYTSTPTNVLAAFAADFTLSFWINTTQDVGSDQDAAFSDVGLVDLDIPGGANDLIPAGLSGGAISFNVGGNDESSLNTTAHVDNGQYRHVVITRDHTTGQRQIYIDGNLNVADTGSIGLMNDPKLVGFGCHIDASQSDPSQAFTDNYFNGTLDDIQLYSRILSPDEITFLFNNPGSTVSAQASGLIAHYTFDNSNNLGEDTSGNGNDLTYNAAPSGNGVAYEIGTTIAGAGAASFDGGSFLGYNSPPTAILSALANNFSLSFWIDTTYKSGDSDNDAAFNGEGIVTADIPGQFNDIIPAALTGGSIAFGNGPDDDTINSTVEVTDGTFHHVVITRDQMTGVKQIYIDGLLNVSDDDTTNVLSDPQTLAIGAKIDASGADPTLDGSSQYFHGLLDDIQIYSRVISAGEVGFLYAHPGSTLTSGAQTIVYPPVSLNFGLQIFREQDPNSGDVFFAFPSFQSVSPVPVTTNTINSPNSHLQTSSTNGLDDGSSSLDFFSLNDLLNEITNGQWTLTINQGDTSQQVFHFTVSLSGITSNLLSPVIILIPTNGATGVPTNSPFQWSGPATFGTVNVNKATYPAGDDFQFTSFPPMATNWTSPPGLDPGTNTFYVEYDSNNIPTATITVPMTATGTLVSNFTYSVDLRSAARSYFTVGGSVPPPVHIVNVTTTANGSLQFSFASTAGHSNLVQSTTSLAPPVNWTPYTNIAGDGTLKTLVVPANTPSQRFFRIITQ